MTDPPPNAGRPTGPPARRPVSAHPLGSVRLVHHPPEDAHAVALALFEAADRVGGSLRSRVAAVLERLGGADALMDPLLGPGPSGLEPVPAGALTLLRSVLSPEAVAWWDDRLRRLRTRSAGTGVPGGGTTVVTVGDRAYPANLGQVADRPPFLFSRGPLVAMGRRLVAVIGTREPSRAGVARARLLATALAEANVVVVSGLAVGIDATAHRAALAAGGPTLAVLGHGVGRPLYPSANRRLSGAILASGGALVSQFWPDQPPDLKSFPARNVTMSGLCVGTVVVEAGERSGARQQARRCLRHGRILFLPRRLVETEPWARRTAELAGVEVFDADDQVLARIDATVAGAPRPAQLAFG